MPSTPGGRGPPGTPGGSQPGTPGPATPGFIASPGGNVAPETPLPMSLMKHSAPSTPAGSALGEHKRTEDEAQDLEHPVPSVPTDVGDAARASPHAGAAPTPLLPPAGGATPLLSGHTTPATPGMGNATPGMGNATPLIDQPIPSVPSVPSVDVPSQPVPSVPSAPSSVLEAATGDEGGARSAKSSPYKGPAEEASRQDWPPNTEVAMPAVGEMTPLLQTLPPMVKPADDSPAAKRQRLDGGETPQPILPMEDSQTQVDADESQR